MNELPTSHPNDSFDADDPILSQEIQPSKGFLKPLRFNPAVTLETLKHLGSLGANVGSVLLFESIAGAGGWGLANINPFTELDPKIPLTIWALSEIPFLHSLSVNAKASWKSLEETGTSVSWLAKLGHDISKRVTPKTSIQKAATYTGFAAYEVGMEITWFAGALLGKEKILEIAPDVYTLNMEYAFLLGANLTGTLFSYLQAGGVEGILHGIRHRERIVDMASNRLDKYSRIVNDIIF